MRYGIFVHDPDGDSGYGVIVGSFGNIDAAEKKADAIRRIAERDDEYIECIVVPVVGQGTAARKIVVDVMYPAGTEV